jgi:hypothetical protein
MRTLLILVVACGGSPPHEPSPANHAPPPACNVVAEHMVALDDTIPREIERTIATATPPYVEIRLRSQLELASRCQADRWSAALRACAVDANTVTALGTCIQKLDPAQLDGLGKEFAYKQWYAHVVPDVIIRLHADGHLELDGKPLPDGDLELALRVVYAREKYTQIVIVADDATSHADVVRVMTLAKAAGFSNLGLSAATP